MDITIRGFSERGNWYKGNLHSHTTNSDGRLTPTEAVELFKSHGYHFLCFSEHDLYTDYRKEFDCDDFIILPGMEASAILCCEGEPERVKKAHHILGILGTEEMQKNAVLPLYQPGERHPVARYSGEWDGAAAAQKLVDEMRQRGMLATYNHPVWSKVRESDFIDTEGLWALEIFNYGTVNESNTGYDETYLDVMLREGKRIFAFASDDNHNWGTYDDACGGYIVVKAEALTHEEVIRNMIAGNYYSSSGPEIYDWGIRGGTAYVECSPVYRIDFMAGNDVGDGAGHVCSTLDETITYGEYPLKGHETYVRVKCTDCHGKIAWSNPLWI